MNTQVVQLESEAPAQSKIRPFFPWLLLLFIGSGCSALIYEIVWYQLLQLAIGSTAVSLGVLLATFMGGLCLGSLAVPRLVTDARHPLKIYAWLELGIGVCGLAVLFGMPLLDHLYVAGGRAWASIHAAARRFVAATLLVPTALMGASLPVAARWIEATPEGVSRLGLLYGGNTVGAVFGCLLAGFYLLRVFDMATATYVAVAINCSVALITLVLTRATGYRASPGNHPARVRLGSWPVYVDDRAIGRVRARRRSDLDAAAGFVIRCNGLHVFDHLGGVPDRDRNWQRRWLRFSQSGSRSPGSPWAGARCCWPPRSHGPLSCWPSRFPIGRLIR